MLGGLIKNINLKEKYVIAIIAVLLLVIAGVVYSIFYAPLMKELKDRYLEYRDIESEIRQARDIIETAGEIYGKRTLMTEEEVSQAVDELTKHGRLKGVNIISMNPGEIIEEADSAYKILPVKMQVESTYEELGTMLGSLDDLEKGLVKVKGFNIVHDEKDPAKLITDLEVDVYISGKDDEG